VLKWFLWKKNSPYVETIRFLPYCSLLMGFVESEEDRIIPIKYPMYLPNYFFHIFSKERERKRGRGREK